MINKFSQYIKEEWQKPFESKQNWSVKRYGNANAVYYNGVLVGYDDREIGNEENVTNPDFYNVEILYSQDPRDNEEFSLYVPDYIWQIFEIENHDIKPIVLKIATKMAENIFKQGFFIKIN